MGSTDCLTDIASSLELFFRGLSDCGLLKTYNVQFLQKNILDSSVKMKFKIVVNEFLINMQKLLQNALTEDELIISVQTKDGVVPLMLMNNEVTDDTDLSPNDSTIYLINEAENESVSIPVSNEQGFEDVPNCSEFLKWKEDTMPHVSEKAESVDNVLDMVYLKKEKNEITEPWQLNILKNEAEDTTIDTITEVMTKNHMKAEGWQCDMCNKIFHRMQKLQHHCREEHNGTGCFECNLCGTRVMSKTSLKRHIRSHSGIKTGTCSICGKTFKRSDYLATHYKLHNGARTYQCSICGKEFTAKTNLTLHERVHSDQKDYSCHQCDKSFSRRDKLRDHMLRHLNIKRFQCSTCNKRYAEKRDLRTHLKVHLPQAS